MPIASFHRSAIGASLRIETAAKRAISSGSGSAKYLYSPRPKPCCRHHDARAEARVVRVERRKLAARLARNELRRDRGAVRVEIATRSPASQANRGDAVPSPSSGVEGRRLRRALERGG